MPFGASLPTSIAGKTSQPRPMSNAARVGFKTIWANPTQSSGEPARSARSSRRPCDATVSLTARTQRSKNIDDKTLGDVLMYEGMKLSRSLDRENDADFELSAVCILFPNLEQGSFANMHAAHTRSKSLLMRGGIMVSVFYPGYERPALYNPEFHLYQSPYPIAAVRPMAIRDLAFVDYNEEAFGEYRRRFGAKYRAGKVPNKFGWVDKYTEAEKRFPPAA